MSTLDETLTGGARLLALVGEPGIGKSRLLREFVELAVDRGCSSFVGQAEMLERERQGGVLVDAFTPVADPDRDRELATSVERLRALAPVDTIAAADAFVDAMTAALTRGPIVFAVENLEWCDETTLVGLRLLLREHEGAPVTLVLASRSQALVTSTTADWPRHARTVVLEPLMREEVSELATSALGATPDARLLRELEGAGGNPLFILELLAALREESRITQGAGSAELLTPHLPEGFRQTVFRRLAQLPERTVRLLKIAAVLGTRFSPTSVAVVLDEPVAALLDDLFHAVEAGLLEEAGDLLIFRHDLAREAIYQDLGQAARTSLHLDAATRLEAAGAPADVVVPHLLASAGGRNHRALELLLSYATQDRGSAPARAAVLFERALAALEPSDPRRAAVMATMVNPMARSGRMRDAELLARELLIAPPDARAAFLAHEALWLVLLRTGRLADYRADVGTVLDTLELSEDERAMALARLANVMTLSGDSAAARQLATAGARDAASRGAHGLEALNLSTVTFIELAGGDVESALAAAQAATRADGRHPDRIQNVQLYLACALADADRLQEAAVVGRRGRSYDEAIGDRSVIAVYHWVLGYIAYLAGDLGTAAAEVEAVLSLRQEREIGQIGLPLGLALGARSALHRGAADEAASLVADWHRVAADRGPQVGEDMLLWVDGLVRRSRGDVAGALATMQQAWEAGEGNRYLLGWRLISADIVHLAVQEGDRELASRVTSAAEAGAARAAGIGSARAAALHCGGVLDRDPDLIAEAEAAWMHAGRPHYGALAARHLGSLLAEEGAHGAAEAALQRAVTRYDTVGATADAGEVAVQITALGREVPRRRPLVGWDALTAAEQEVVALVKEGMTNREVGERLCISRHTVDSHLRHVFQKLGVRSRVQLASRAAREQGQNHANA